jgi:glycosyltransferase involved in cell wall biosynthesis
LFFTEKKLEKDIGKYYNASDCLIVSLIDEPISSDTVPAKVQTYIAAKKPILAIINGDTADIVIDNGLGLYADSSDIKSIKKSFIDFIDLSEQKKEEFIAHSEKLLKEDFNKERIINKLTSVLIGQ